MGCDKPSGGAADREQTIEHRAVGDVLDDLAANQRVARVNGRRATGPRVLVTEGQERWVIAVCRSLATAGFTVTVAADSRPAVAHWSRFCARRLKVPPPQSDPGLFVDLLEAEVRSKPYTLLIPCGEASMRAISEARERLAPLLRASLGLPPNEVVQAATDKLCLLEAARRSGLPCPESIICSGPQDGLDAAARLGYPVVVKPQTAFVELHGGVAWRPSRMARTPQELAPLTQSFGSSYLVQRAQAGTVHSCSGVYADGEFLALSLARYIRTWPPEAGNAAFAETIAIPPDLPERVRVLLGSIGWQGIFELEFMRSSDGAFTTLDLNPRTYGSMALAIRAGADLPALWCEWLLGGRPDPVFARPGFHYRWEDAELRRLVWEIRRGSLSGAAAVLRPRARTVHPHFRWDDPAPLFARGLYLVRGRLSRHAPEIAPPTATDARHAHPDHLHT